MKIADALGVYLTIGFGGATTAAEPLTVKMVRAPNGQIHFDEERSPVAVPYGSAGNQ